MRPRAIMSSARTCISDRDRYQLSEIGHPLFGIGGKLRGLGVNDDHPPQPAVDVDGDRHGRDQTLRVIRLHAGTERAPWERSASG
jgi:hypothetical protein